MQIVITGPPIPVPLKQENYGDSSGRGSGQAARLRPDFSPEWPKQKGEGVPLSLPTPPRRTGGSRGLARLGRAVTWLVSPSPPVRAEGPEGRDRRAGPGRRGRPSIARGPSLCSLPPPVSSPLPLPAPLPPPPRRQLSAAAAGLSRGGGGGGRLPGVLPFPWQRGLLAARLGAGAASAGVGAGPGPRGPEPGRRRPAVAVGTGCDQGGRAVMAAGRQRRHAEGARGLALS